MRYILYNVYLYTVISERSVDQRPISLRRYLKLILIRLITKGRFFYAHIDFAHILIAHIVTCAYQLAVAHK